MAYVTLQDATDVVVFPSTLAEVYQHQQKHEVLAEARCFLKICRIAARPAYPEVYAEIKKLVTKYKAPELFLVNSKTR